MTRLVEGFQLHTPTDEADSTRRPHPVASQGPRSLDVTFAGGTVVEFEERTLGTDGFLWVHALVVENYARNRQDR